MAALSFRYPSERRIFRGIIHQEIPAADPARGMHESIWLSVQEPVAVHWFNGYDHP
jgi:hypothetical protein